MTNTLLITGGAGFIGSHFTKYWIATHLQDRVVALDALTYAGNTANLAEVWNDPRFRFIPGRIQDQASVEWIFKTEKITRVVNFAAESHNDRSLLDPGALIQTNVYGVSVLLEAARKFGVERFLHVSTDEVYGTTDTGVFKEDDPLLPNTPYSAGKAGGEMVVRAHHVAYGIPTLVTRGGNTFGPNQYPEKLISFSLTRLLQGKKIPLYGDGSQRREWIAVRDHCAGIATVLEKGEPGQIYNVGDHNERTNLWIMQRLLSELGMDERLIKRIEDPRGGAHDRRYSMDTAKLQRMGWKPERSFDEALSATVRWYRENESWWRPIVESEDYQTFVRRFYGRYLGEDL